MPSVDRENKLFVGMLPHDADDMTLTEVFSRFGEITEVSMSNIRSYHADEDDQEPTWSFCLCFENIGGGVAVSCFAASIDGTQVDTDGKINRKRTTCFQALQRPWRTRGLD